MRATITVIANGEGWKDTIDEPANLTVKTTDGLLVICKGEDDILAVYERGHVVSVILERDDEPDEDPASATQKAEHPDTIKAKTVGDIVRERAESMELFARAANNLPHGTGITPFRLLTGEPGALVSHTDRHGTALTLTDEQTRAVADGHASVYTDDNGNLHLGEAHIHQG